MEKNKLPQGWVIVNVDLISEVVTGNTPSKKNSKFYGGNIPYFKPADLNSEYYVKTSADKLSKLGLEHARKIPERSILVTCIGATIGKVGFNRISGATNQQINSLIPNSSVIIPELLYFFSIAPQFQESIIENSSSTTIPIINKNKFSQLTISLPPFNEQKRIVYSIEKLFSELDNLKITLETMRMKLNQYRQILLKSAFEGKLTDTWRIKNGWKKNDVDQNTLLPITWSMKPLFEVADINPKKPEKGKIDDGLEVSFIPMKCVEELTGKIDLSITRKYIEVKKGYTYFKNADIIFAKITPCMENGKIAIVKELKNELGFGSTEFHVIRLKENEASQKFYFYYLIQDNFRNSAQRNMKGTAGQLRVSSYYLNNIAVPVIPFNEQKQIVLEIEEKFSLIQNTEEITNSMLERLVLLKSSILKKAFEGKLVAQNPNDESTERLLEKIKLK